jgi:hypothetical protein
MERAGGTRDVQEPTANNGVDFVHQVELSNAVVDGLVPAP